MCQAFAKLMYNVTVIIKRVPAHLTRISQLNNLPQELRLRCVEREELEHQSKGHTTRFALLQLFNWMCRSVCMYGVCTYECM